VDIPEQQWNRILKDEKNILLNKDTKGQIGYKIKKARIEIQPVLNPISYEKPS
jgi:hypothetical protein